MYKNQNQIDTYPSSTYSQCNSPSSTTITKKSNQSNKSNALFATLVELNSSFTAVVVRFLADRWQFILRVSTKFENSGNQQYCDHEFVVFNNMNLAFLTILCCILSTSGEYNPLLM